MSVAFKIGESSLLPVEGEKEGEGFPAMGIAVLSCAALGVREGRPLPVKGLFDTDIGTKTDSLERDAVGAIDGMRVGIVDVVLFAGTEDGIVG